MKDGRIEVGDVLRDYRRGDRVVCDVIRPEQLHRYTDGAMWRGSTSERCALHGGKTRRQVFQVREG